MRAVTDEQLIQWVADGDASCLATLFERHHKAVYQFCLQMTRHPTESEDLVQDVFYRILKQEDLPALRNPRAFLMAATRNAAIDRLRKLKANPLVEAGPEQGAPGRALLDGAETMIAIEQALKLLPARQRQVFVLQRFKGMDTRSVAEALGISPRMVQKHLAKAMSHFHEQLGI